MRTTLKWARAAMAAVLCFAIPLGELSAADMRGRNQGQAGNDSILRIPGNAAFPLTKQVELGVAVRWWCSFLFR